MKNTIRIKLIIGILLSLLVVASSIAVIFIIKYKRISDAYSITVQNYIDLIKILYR